MSIVVYPSDPDKKLKLLNLGSDNDENYTDHYSLFHDFVEAVVLSGWCGREELLENFVYYARTEIEKAKEAGEASQPEPVGETS